MVGVTRMPSLIRAAGEGDGLACRFGNSTATPKAAAGTSRGWGPQNRQTDASLTGGADPNHVPCNSPQGSGCCKTAYSSSCCPLTGGVDPDASASTGCKNAQNLPQPLSTLTGGVDPDRVPHRLRLLLALEGPQEHDLACMRTTRSLAPVAAPVLCTKCSAGLKSRSNTNLPELSRHQWRGLSACRLLQQSMQHAKPAHACVLPGKPCEHATPVHPPGGYISVVSALCRSQPNCPHMPHQLLPAPPARK
jgi:hypothetical protein